MRTFAALVLFALAAAPLAAQVSVRGLANVGFDAGFDAPSAGVGVELGWAPPGAPVALALRPSADLVFAEVSRTADPLLNPAALPPPDRSNVTRAGAEVVARSTVAVGPALPYLKAGAVWEYQATRVGDVYSGRWERDAVAGAGALFGRLYLEGTLGFGDASRSRLALGVRF